MFDADHINGSTHTPALLWVGLESEFQSLTHESDGTPIVVVYAQKGL